MNGPSHNYAFPASDALRLLARPVIAVVIAAVALHLADRLEWLPAPVPANLDQTILSTKARLALRKSPASILLLGDSSCLMDVEARDLAAQLGNLPTLNLGTLSYLDLETQSRLLAKALAAHPFQPPRTVVLLLHPEALRGSSPSPTHIAFLDAQLSTPGSRLAASQALNRLESALAGVTFRERIIQPFIPVPLHGDWSTAYGCNLHLAQILLHRDGSLSDPTRPDPHALLGNAEYRLGNGIEPASRAFRHAIPNGTRLAIGITPTPQSLASNKHSENIRRMLGTWSTWIGADRVLTNLPPVMPDSKFATHTHLNAEGAREFTARLAEALRE